MTNTKFHGYFYEGLRTIRDLRMTTTRGKALVEITPIATLRLTDREYNNFSNSLMTDWRFLEPYSRRAGFCGGLHADCVMVEAAGHPTIAVVLDGYRYAKYIALAQ